MLCECGISCVFSLICLFLVSCVLAQIAIEPFALFRHSVFNYMCFTVMFHR